MDKKVILLMGAHPDDIELEAGGSLAKWAKKGHEVHMLVLASGKYRSIQGLSYSAETLQEEATKSSRILGAKEIHFFGYEPTKLPSNGEIISEVDSLINELHPDLIISHHPFDSHQDHKAAAEIMFALCRQGRIKNALCASPLPYRPNIFAFKPQVFIDITSTLELKQQALRCYNTQYQKYGQEKWIERVTAMARMYGWGEELDYAESFEVVRLTNLYE